ncbi:DUF2478 domain-containing protein [Labrys neptuniae]
MYRRYHHAGGIRCKSEEAPLDHRESSNGFAFHAIGSGMIDAGRIAVIASRTGEDTQAFLAALAHDWRRDGQAIVGVVAENPNAATGCSAGFLRDLASGKRFSIHLDSPRADTGCQLDARGVEAACSELLAQIPASELVVLSKFGKLEATQQGLWRTFLAAVGAGKPVLTTVSSRHMEAWKAIASSATWLEPDRSTIEEWRREVAISAARSVSISSQYF